MDGDKICVDISCVRNSDVTLTPQQRALNFELVVSDQLFSVILIIIFSTDAFARRECSLLLPPVKEGRGIIQLRYAPRS
jgi:hypothetical protein